MTFASGGADLSACGPPAIFSLHLTSSTVTPVGSAQGGHRVAYVDAVEEMMCVRVWVLQIGHSGDGYDLVLTLCMYCSGRVLSILLLPLVASCLETIDV